MGSGGGDLPRVYPATSDIGRHHLPAFYCLWRGAGWVYRLVLDGQLLRLAVDQRPDRRDITCEQLPSCRLILPPTVKCEWFELIAVLWLELDKQFAAEGKLFWLLADNTFLFRHFFSQLPVVSNAQRIGLSLLLLISRLNTWVDRSSSIPPPPQPSASSCERNSCENSVESVQPAQKLSLCYISQL